MTSTPAVAEDVDARPLTDLGRSPVVAVVPFAYDLGGRVTDVALAVAALEALPDVVGPVGVDPGAVRSWNLSYLAGHAPVLRCDLSPGEAVLGRSTWSFSRVLRLYPWLGVVTVEYTFVPDDAADVTAFYDGLIAWKNGDYLPHLAAQGALNAHLQAHTGWQPSDDDPDLHRGSLDRLRDALEELGAVERRPRRYAFHDLRPTFVVEAEADADLVGTLLLLGRGAIAGSAEDAEVWRCRLHDVQVSSTGWSTVLRRVGPSGVEDARRVLDLLGLVHAQWFLCQAWISTYDADRVVDELRPGATAAEELARTHLALARELVEVDSLDLMLKDPALLRVARCLATAFGVREHRAAAERRLRVLDDYARQLAEVTQAKDAQRLQILFSLSAAGTIAGLVPAVAALQSSVWLTVATVVVGVALWLGFAVNFAVLIRRRAAGRTSRRPAESLWRTART